MIDPNHALSTIPQAVAQPTGDRTSGVPMSDRTAMILSFGVFIGSAVLSPVLLHRSVYDSVAVGLIAAGVTLAIGTLSSGRTPA